MCFEGCECLSGFSAGFWGLFCELEFCYDYGRYEDWVSESRCCDLMFLCVVSGICVVYVEATESIFVFFGLVWRWWLFCGPCWSVVHILLLLIWVGEVCVFDYSGFCIVSVSRY